MAAYTKPEIIILDAEKMIPQARITNYESFSWTHNWYGIDEFTIKVNRYKNGVDQFRDESYIAFKDSEGTWKVGILGKVTKPKGPDGKSSEQFTINGIGIEGIFNNSPCMKDFANSTTGGYTVLQSMSIETAMRQIVNDTCINNTFDTGANIPGLSLNVVDYKRPVSTAWLDLRFSGTAGSTTITDSSQYNRALTNQGVTISATQSKFNGTSGYFNGSSYIEFANLDMSGDWSWSAWIYPTSANQTSIIFGQRILQNCGIIQLASGVFTVGAYNTSFSLQGTNVTTNTWHYLTVRKKQIDSTHWQITLWQDGVQTAQTTTTVNMINVIDPYAGGVGAWLGAGYYFTGYLADVVFRTDASIDGTIVPTTQFSDPNVAEKSVRTDTVASVLESLGRQSGVSSRLTWNGAAITGPTSDRRLFQFDVLEGNDLSTGTNAVKLSVEFGNLLTYEYVYSVLNSKNFLYVGGSGDGANRLLTTAHSGDTVPTGWDRRAAFFDSTESTTAAQAQAAGAAQLLTLGPEQTLTFDYNYMSNSYKYGTHFKLGDIVVAKVADVAEITARITQVTETYDENGKKLSFGMGTSSIDLVSILKAQIKATRKLQAH